MRDLGIDSISVHQDLEINEKESLVICDYLQALRVREEYDLVIYDDVNSFPIHKKPEMQHLIGFIFPKCRKVVAYSFELVFMGMDVIEVPMAGKSGFVSEPRVLETRLNLDEFVPTSVYEYLLWFVFEKKKVLFVTTNKKVKKKVARFLTKIDESLESCIYDVDEIGTTTMRELCSDHTKSNIFITDNLDDYVDMETNFEIIIHGADASRYSYRELIFLCLRSGYYDEMNGEVLMICQNVTRDIEKTRDLARHYNKVLWDEGFE
jgi:late competence protein required for DNA uptake (superfamily II DNA/RNA helicase)